MSGLAHWKKVAKSGSFNHKQVSEMYRLYRKGHGRFGGKVTDKISALKKGLMKKLTPKSSQLARFIPSRTQDPDVMRTALDIINSRRILEKPDEKAAFDRRVTEADERLAQANTRRDDFFQSKPHMNHPNILNILKHIQWQPKLAKFMKEKWANYDHPETIDWVKEAYENRIVGTRGYVIRKQFILGHNWEKGDKNNNIVMNLSATFLRQFMASIITLDAHFIEYADILKEIKEAEAVVKDSKKKTVNPLDTLINQGRMYEPNHVEKNFPAKGLQGLSNVFNRER